MKRKMFLALLEKFGDLGKKSLKKVIFRDRVDAEDDRLKFEIKNVFFKRRKFMPSVMQNVRKFVMMLFL